MDGFDCKHRCIFEASYEWLECKCKLDGKIHDIMFPKCTGYEKEENDNDR